MRIFISWSGEPSRILAAYLPEWIRDVIQSAEPFVSEAIPKGTKWFGEVDAQLKDAAFGICCVTPYNQKELWLLFSA